MNRLRWFRWIFCVGIGLACCRHAVEPVAAQAPNVHAEFLSRYCIDCHSTDEPSGQRDFETLDLANSALDTQIQIQEVIDQLTLEAMPPPDAEQPSSQDRVLAINRLTSLLATMREQTASTGGQSVLRRLSRREYRNTVRDLLSIDMTAFDPTIGFPADNLTQSADNFGDTQVTSGHLLEKYLEAADRCVEKAFEIDAPPRVQEWTFDGDFIQQQELNRAHKLAFDYRYLVLYDHPLNDKPEGAYGHLPHLAKGVEVSGIYEVEVLAQALNRDTPYNEKSVLLDLDEPFRMGIRPGDTSIGDMVHTQPIEPKIAEVVIEDDEVQWYKLKIPLDRGFAPRFTFENGQHDVRGAYQRVFRNHKATLPSSVQDSQGIVDWRNAVIKHGYLPQIRIHEVRLRGPVDVPWPTPTRSLILGGESFDESKASEWIARFASRAYRRPATAAEVDALVSLYRSRIDDRRLPVEAFKDTLKAVMCSPAFLYLSPPEQPERVHLSQHGLASRLSYFLTSTMPDDSLIGLANRGELDSPAVLQAEARRLLASSASDAFVADFLDSWLNLRTLGSMPPDPKDSRIYYAAGLEPEMKRETQLFMRDLIDRNASALEFIQGDYSFVNRDLAKLYGVGDLIPVDRAADFQRIRFEDPQRGGLLGQASILTVSANGIETSPVTRGVWLLETVLGSRVPPPPDTVPALDPDVRGATSIRDQLAKHRESEACNQCHRKFDPLGFALEGFDPIGRSRQYYDQQRRTKIDTSGVMPGGDQFQGPAELRAVLLKRKEFFVRALTARLFSHALGRRMEASDRSEIDKAIAEVNKDDYPLTDLVTAVVSSDLFRQR